MLLKPERGYTLRGEERLVNDLVMLLNLEGGKGSVTPGTSDTVKHLSNAHDELTSEQANCFQA